MSVRMSPAPGFVVGPERHAPGALERGLDELRVDDIEIDARTSLVPNGMTTNARVCMRRWTLSNEFERIDETETRVNFIVIRISRIRAGPYWTAWESSRGSMWIGSRRQRGALLARVDRSVRVGAQGVAEPALKSWLRCQLPRSVYTAALIVTTPRLEPRAAVTGSHKTVGATARSDVSLLTAQFSAGS